MGLACALIVLGAATDLKGHHEFDFLAIERDAWTDARILASSAYADVFVTNDRRLKKRAELIASWGLFRPRVLLWSELAALR